MPYVIALVAVVVVAIVLAVCSAKQKVSPEQDRPVPIVEEDASGLLSQEQVRRRLRELARSTPPAPPKMGAMCYTPAPPPQQANYVCPTCGAKTVYAVVKASEHQTVATPAVVRMIDWELSACRRTVKELPGSNIQLDETTFCRHCRPKAAKQELVLLVKYADRAEPHRCAGVTSYDLELLKEFLANKTAYSGAKDGELPLKDRLPRIEELLGVKLDTTAK
jgi:hypothetical protein